MPARRDAAAWRTVSVFLLLLPSMRKWLLCCATKLWRSKTLWKTPLTLVSARRSVCYYPPPTPSFYPPHRFRGERSWRDGDLGPRPRSSARRRRGSPTSRGRADEAMEVDDDEIAAEEGAPAPSADGPTGPRVIKTESKTVDESAGAKVADQNAEPVSEEPADGDTPQDLCQNAVSCVASNTEEESATPMNIDPTVERETSPDANEAGTSPPDDAADKGGSAMPVEAKSGASPAIPAETPPPTVERQANPAASESDASLSDDAANGGSAMLVKDKSDVSLEMPAEAPSAEAKSDVVGLGPIELKSVEIEQTESRDGFLPEQEKAVAGSQLAEAESGDDSRTEQGKSDASPRPEVQQPTARPEQTVTTTDHASAPTAEAEPRAVECQPPAQPPAIETSQGAAADTYVASSSRIVTTNQATGDVGFGSSEVVTQASARTMNQLATSIEEKMEQSIAAPTVRRKDNARLLMSMLAVLLFGVLVGVLIGGPSTGTTTNVSSVSSESQAWTSSDSPVSTPSLRPVGPPKENVEMDEFSHRGESTQASSTLPSSRTTALPSMSPSSAPIRSPTDSPTEALPSLVSTPSLRPVSPPKENVEMDELSHRGESTLVASSTLPSSRTTALPSMSPSSAPIRSPTDSPTEALPSYPPSADPSSSPTSGPTKQPVTESPTTPPSSKPSVKPTMKPTPTGPLTFLAIGDVECLLPIELNKLTTSSGRFLVHLGDIQDGKINSCPESLHIGISRVFEASPVPTFFIIGDNGWLDCNNVDESYSYWEKHLFTYHSRTDLDWPALGATVNHNPDYPEFFSFNLEGILFLGRALPATENVYRKFTNSQWLNYLRINAAATRSQIESNYGRIRAAVVFGHNFGAEGGVTATFFEQMTSIAADFPELPILLMQDNHWWGEKIFSGYPNLYKLALDDTVTPTSITIDPEAKGGIKDIFKYDRGCWCTEGHRPTKLTNWPSSGACAGVCDTNKQCASEEPCGSFGTGDC